MERTKRTENLHTQEKDRERRQQMAKEEAVKKVAESMHECNQRERVLRSDQQRGRCSVKFRSGSDDPHVFGFDDHVVRGQPLRCSY